jgi:hypothetical protein
MSFTTPLRDSDGDSADNAADESYRLVSVAAVRAPEGCAGRDWFVYRIAQGANEITGYRRGERAAVDAEVATIVAGLNGRRSWSKGKPASKAQRRAASQIRLGNAE